MSFHHQPLIVRAGRGFAAVLFLLVYVPAGAAVADDPPGPGDAFRELGHQIAVDARTFGATVARESRQLGHQIAVSFRQARAEAAHESRTAHRRIAAQSRKARSSIRQSVKAAGSSVKRAVRKASAALSQKSVNR